MGKLLLLTAAAAVVALSPVRGAVGGAFFPKVEVRMAKQDGYRQAGGPSRPDGPSPRAGTYWRVLPPHGSGAPGTIKPLHGATAKSQQRQAVERQLRIYGLRTKERKMARAILAKDAAFRRILRHSGPKFTVTKTVPWTDRPGRVLMGAGLFVTLQRPLENTEVVVPDAPAAQTARGYTDLKVHGFVETASRFIVLVDFRRRKVVRLIPDRTARVRGVPPGTRGTR